MNKLLLLRAKGLLVSILLLVAMLLVQAENAHAIPTTRPQSPLLTLTGTDGPTKYEGLLYPDGRIWLPPSTSKVREFLLPVFIKNDFFTFDNNYIAPPIYSFKFSLLYDSSALRATGVETKHPDFIEKVGLLQDTKDLDPPFANGFNISWDDQKDPDFWRYIDFKTWKDNPNQGAKGRRVTVTGTSSSPLPHNDKLFTDDWKVLLYVKFKVVAAEVFNNPNTQYLKTPVYIDPREIKYNDLDVTKQLPYEGFTYYNPDTYRRDYPVLGTEPGLEGLRNDNMLGGTESIFYQLEPYLPGMLWVWISDREPNFNFPSDPSSGFTISEVSANSGLWQLDQAITVDSNDAAAKIGSQLIEVQNKESSTRLSQIEVTSDSPWLQFKSELISGTGKNPWPTPRTYGYCNWLDNGILGVRKDPRGEDTPADEKLNMRIICDPTFLSLKDKNDPEKAGVYVGYLTFKSPTAKSEPVRLKVTFVYIRNPFEPAGSKNPSGYPGGIFLTLKNSNSPVQDSRTIVFGTAHRATAGVDSLMGEFHPASNISTTSFDARFFPYAEIYPTEAALYPNGFGDFAPSQLAPNSVSRDIRNYNSKRTHIFYCRFNAGAASNYPVTLQYDTEQFPAGARLFLKYIVNGVVYPAIDMRNGSPIGPTQMSYVFTDPRVNEFLIEYTLPKTIDYVDQFNEPIIKTGWNLLSLPVRPTNSLAEVVYPNAINRQPYMFTQNQYDPVTLLKPGIGYFVKYGSVIDRQFSGTEIRELRNESPLFDEIRLYVTTTDPKHPGDTVGWNCIGALTYPINVADIAFTQFANAPLPGINYTMEYGVWGYRTNKGYYEASQMLPGLGYWLKVNSPGYMKLVAKNIPPESDKVSVSDNQLTKTEILKNCVEVAIRDNSQNETSVYLSANSKLSTSTFELPPVPVRDAFDVRFTDGNYVANGNSNIIKVQAVTYPISLTFTTSDADYTVKDAITGKEFGSVKKGTASSITIEKSSNAIKIEKAPTFETSISNFPNPVVTSSTIKYSIADAGFVTMKLYDALGNEVMNIFEGNQKAGEYTETINAANLANGNYIVKMFVNGNATVAKINVVK